MQDRERIARIVSDIERYLRDLSLFGTVTSSDLTDRKNYYALSMILFSLLEGIIDLADEVVGSRNLGSPGTYREIFLLLNRNGLIDRETYDRMSLLVSFRNRLAHEYGEITPDDLLRILSMIPEIRVFVGQMKILVKEE